jgi:hypothetical protein
MACLIVCDSDLNLGRAARTAHSVICLYSYRIKVPSGPIKPANKHNVAGGLAPFASSHPTLLTPESAFVFTILQDAAPFLLHNFSFQARGMPVTTVLKLDEIKRFIEEEKQL